MPARYAIMLDVTDRRIVIIGGGAVAARKAGGLLDAGATDVHVFAPALDGKMPPEVKWTQAAYEPAQLDGAFLAFAATSDPAVNDAVMRDAAARGILASRADADEAVPGEFVVPARFSQGAIQVAVSAGSAALSAAVRDRLQAALDPRLVKMADAMRELRPLIRDRSGLDADTRREIFRALTGEAALDVLDHDGIAALKAWLVGRFPQMSAH
jgi:siroheme synthase-like protein